MRGLKRDFPAITRRMFVSSVYCVQLEADDNSFHHLHFRAMLVFLKTEQLSTPNTSLFHRPLRRS